MIMHRKIYKEYHGSIPKNHHIHHIDGNRNNNTIGNLVAVSPVQHFTIHWLQWVISGKKSEKISAQYLLPWTNKQLMERKARRLSAAARGKTVWNTGLTGIKTYPKQAYSLRSYGRFLGVDNKTVRRYALEDIRPHGNSKKLKDNEIRTD